MINQDNLQIKNGAEPEVFKEFLSSLGKDTQYTFNHFGEINSNTINSIIEKEIARNDKIKFFTFLNDKLIAYSFLTKFEKTTKRHNCILGIVVGDKWQNKGYGKKICEYMINHAWKSGFTKIWLAAYVDNKTAYNLYKSLGFEVEGIFMNDEVIGGKDRHIISMAIFKDKNFDSKQRFKIWKTIEKDSL